MLEKEKITFFSEEVWRVKGTPQEPCGLGVWTVENGFKHGHGQTSGSSPKHLCEAEAPIFPLWKDSSWGVLKPYT